MGHFGYTDDGYPISDSEAEEMRLGFLMENGDVREVAETIAEVRPERVPARIIDRLDRDALDAELAKSGLILSLELSAAVYWPMAVEDLVDMHLQTGPWAPPVGALAAVAVAVPYIAEGREAVIVGGVAS